MDQFKRILINKTELGPDYSADDLEDLEKEWTKKLKELERKEEQFNYCVAIIPETDENAIKLTEEIQRLKDQMDRCSHEFTRVRDEFNSV